jgi:predicted KAP-like P-loop ATPase
MEKAELGKTKKVIQRIYSFVSVNGIKEAFYYIIKIVCFSIFVSFVIYYLIGNKTLGSVTGNIISKVPLWYSNLGITLLLLFFLFGISIFNPVKIFCLKYLRTVFNTPNNIATDILLVSVIFISNDWFCGRRLVSTIFEQSHIDSYFTYLTSFYFGFTLSFFVNFFYKLLKGLFPPTLSYKLSAKPSFQTDISDDPITTPEDDVLDRGDFVNEIYKQVVNLPFSSSFVFALQGEWGEGKTSTINLLETKLKKDKRHIIFKFDPWYFENERILVETFMRDLGIVISNNYLLPSLRKTFSVYGKLIFGLLEKYSQVSISNFIDLFLKDETLEEVRNSLVTKLASINKKIIIVIDNIDRLQENEILTTFKLIKLVGNFPNTIFILSFDQDVVNKTLKNLCNTDKNFQEKIIQKVIQLPKPRQTTLDQYLGRYLDDLIDTTDIPKKEKETITKNYQSFYPETLRSHFSTLRIIKRYLNSLRATVASFVKSEVSLFDVILLEVIKASYSDVYGDIWKNRWYYMSYDWDWDSSSSSPFSTVIKDDQLNEEIRNHISELITDYPKEDQRIIRSILAKVFLPVEKALHKQNYDFSRMSSEYRTDRRMSHPDIFKKYFSHNIGKEEIFDSDVRNIIQAINSLMNNPTKLRKAFTKSLKVYQSNKNLSDFVQRLDVFVDDFSNEVAENLIEVIYSYAEKRQITDISKLGFESDYHRLFALMYTILDKKVDKKRIQATLEKIIKNASIYYALMSASWATSNELAFNNVKENANKERVLEMIDKRLDNYFIKPKLDIFKMNRKMSGFILRSWAIFSDKSKAKVNKYVFSLIDINKSYVGRIIDGFIVTWSNLRSQIEYTDLQNIYDVEKLHEITKKINKSLYKNTREKKAIEIFNKVYEEVKAKAIEKPTGD